MYKGYKTELNPTKEQEQLLKQSCGVARFVWNWALDRINNKISKPNAFSLGRELNIIKRDEFPWMYDVSCGVPQITFKYLQEATKRSWSKQTIATRNKKIAQATTDKEKAIAVNYAKPNFKTKNKDDRFTVNSNIEVYSDRIKLPKTGDIKLKEHNYLPIGKMKNATVSYRAGRWFVSVKQEVFVDTPPIPITNEVIGIDLGIKELAVCSNGLVFKNPKYLKKSMKKLKRQQRRLSKRVKGSNNRKKQQLKISKIHYKVSCQRQDHLHKTTTALVKTKPKAIVVEDLNVQGMMANHKLAQAISDCGFYEFKRQLEYKCKLNGVILHVIDRFFPSSKTCNKCGQIKEDLTLKDRIYKCECGYEADRDLNSSYNIRDVYLKQIP